MRGFNPIKWVEKKWIQMEETRGDWGCRCNNMLGFLYTTLHYCNELLVSGKPTPLKHMSQWEG